MGKMENFLEQGREPTTGSTHIGRRVQESNPNQIPHWWETFGLTTAPSLQKRNSSVALLIGSSQR